MRRRGGRAASCSITSPPGRQTRYEIEGKPVTGSENVFAFRAVVGLEHRIPLRLRRQDPPPLRRRPADADRRVHRDDAGDSSGIHASRARLHVDDAAQDAGHRAAGDLAGRHADRVCRGRRHLRDAGERRRRRQPHEGRRARYRSVVVAGRRVAGLFVGPGQPAPAAVGPRHEERRQPQGHQHHHAAAGRVVLARRQAHRVLQRRRHVARRRDVDPRSRLAAASPRFTTRCRSRARRRGRPTASASRWPASRR